jgi:N-methylhydantoinase B
VERFRSLCDEYGADEVLAIVAELINRAEALTRAKIAEIPDGVYTFWDYLDNDGIVFDRKVKIQATMTIKGTEIHVDFAGTDPQVLGAANASYSHAACVAYYCVRCVTDPTLPNNAGCFRPLSFCRRAPSSIRAPAQSRPHDDRLPVDRRHLRVSRARRARSVRRRRAACRA